MNTTQRFWTVLRQLFLALLNATLLIALALVVMIWLTLGRAQDLASQTRGALDEVLAPQAARLERIATSVEGIESRLAAGTGGAELRAEIAGLRNDIAEVRSDIRTARDMAPRFLLERARQLMGDWLGDRHAR